MPIILEYSLYYTYWQHPVILIRCGWLGWLRSFLPTFWHIKEGGGHYKQYVMCLTLEDTQAMNTDIIFINVRVMKVSVCMYYSVTRQISAVCFAIVWPVTWDAGIENTIVIHTTGYITIITYITHTWTWVQVSGEAVKSLTS